jgi:hypothetical protein
VKEARDECATAVSLVTAQLHEQVAEARATAAAAVETAEQRTQRGIREAQERCDADVRAARQEAEQLVREARAAATAAVTTAEADAKRAREQYSSLESAAVEASEAIVKEREEAWEVQRRALQGRIDSLSAKVATMDATVREALGEAKVRLTAGCFRCDVDAVTRHAQRTWSLHMMPHAAPVLCVRPRVASYVRCLARFAAT